MAGRFLAQFGSNPPTGLAIVQPEGVRRINALMLTCGHYDGSGEFAYRVGLPGKSGVGGGILAIRPAIPPLPSGRRASVLLATRSKRTRGFEQENGVVDLRTEGWRIELAFRE